MADLIAQLQDQRMVEDLENIVWCAERGIPAEPRVVRMGKIFVDSLKVEFMRKYAPSTEVETPPSEPLATMDEKPTNKVMPPSGMTRAEQAKLNK